MKLQKLTYRLLILSAGFLIVIIAIFYLLYVYNKPNEFVCRIPVPQVFCGTKNLSEKAERGKEIFNQNCAACHKLKAKCTGPALEKTDSIKYWKWLGHNESKIDNTKLDLLSIDYHQSFSRKNLKQSDLTMILEYINEK